MAHAESATIIRAIENAHFRVTAADLSVRTGIPAHALAEGLSELVRETKSRLLVDDDGNIAYEFDPALKHRRVSVSFADRVLFVVSGLFYLVRVLFKLAMVVLFLGFALLYALPVAIVVGVIGAIGTILAVLFSGQGDAIELVARILTEDDPTVRAIGFSVLGLIVLGVVIHRTGRALTGVAQFLMRLGHPSSASARESGRGAGAERLMERLYRFAVGPKLPKPAPARADDALVLERVRRRGGFLLASDLVRWQGQSLRAADEEATRLLIEHRGEPIAVDPGVVAFTFPNLSVTAGARRTHEATRQDDKTRFEQMEALYDITANSRRTDFFIIVTLLFFLAGGLAAVAFSPYGWMTVALGWVPLGFAGTTLVLPLLRWPPLLVLNRGVRFRNAERLLVESLFQQLTARRRIKADHLAKEVFNKLTRWTQEQPERLDTTTFADERDADEAKTALAEASQDEAACVTPSLARRVVAQGLKRYGGEPDVETGDDKIWCFPELTRMLEAGRALQKSPPAILRAVGAPVFDSDSRDV